MMSDHSGVTPKIMSLETLKEITNNFSKEREFGGGTFGIVYKGVQDGEEIAVKQLPMTQVCHDDHKKFKAEFENLWRLRHPNIVQLLGYCYERKHDFVRLNDGSRADNIYRALCFEYMHNGSLEKHLYDEYHGHDWHTRYKIIRGICDGLKYLHDGLNIPMYHLHLKPENILLDKHMVPKLAAFGLSKFIHNDRTQATQNYIGMRGYLPPEYNSNGVVPNKFDIFSLGVVMIRIIAGNEGYLKKAEMSSQQFSDLVYEKWRNRLHTTPSCTTPEAKCDQVKTCIEIALDCIDADQTKRPIIRDIVRKLNELEAMVSAAPSQPQRTSVIRGPKESDTDVKKGLTELPKATTNVLGKTRFEVASPGFSKLLDEPPVELLFPLEASMRIQYHANPTNRCEEVINKTADVSQSSIDTAEQGNVMVSSSTAVDTVIKKLNKVGRLVHQEPNVSAKDQKSGASSKDAKMVLPQLTVQQQQLQQTQMKELNPWQQPKLTSCKTPLPVAEPVKAHKSIGFSNLDKDIDNIFSGFINNADIREDPRDDNADIREDSRDDNADIKFDGLLHTDGEKDFLDEHQNVIKTNGFNTDGVSQSKTIAEQTNVLSGLMDSKTISEKPKKARKLVQPLDSKPDVISQFKKLHLGRGANGLPTDDTSGKDQKSRCSKDGKIAPLQKLTSVSPKMPLNLSVEEVIIDEPSMFRIAADIQDYGFAVDIQEPKMIKEPFVLPLDAGNGDKKGASSSKTCVGGNEMQFVGTLRTSKLPDAHQLELPFPSKLSEAETMEQKFLESILNGRQEPRNLTLPLLKFITKNFSCEYKIGHGGCGEVYKGILSNGIVAVKRLFNSRTIDDKMFHQEVGSLMMVKHQNIVRFLGYCSNTEGNYVRAEARERFVMAEARERLLCFEYISNGNLEKHLTDELRGLEWHRRYQIIKGICEGLNHLHKEKGIFHMDLKPGNILIDDHMVPKITDFGQSRFNDISQTVSESRLVSRGYCAPEYIEDGKISHKADIYSLGKTIIETVTGCKKEPNIINVLRRWRHRWNKLPRDTLLWHLQVSKCLELAVRCIQNDPNRRPSICEIIHELNEIDNNYKEIRNATKSTFAQLISSCLRGMLGVDPLEIHFPLTPDNKLPSCSIQLTNNTDDYIGFMVSPTSLLSYSIQPKKGIIRPHDNRDVTLTLQQAQGKAVLRNHCRDEFCVQSIRIHESLSTMNVPEDMFRVEGSNEVDEVCVTVVFDTLRSKPEEP